ncbi:porin family protein [Pseudoxanthomonas winnipegensis]|uniref:Porin family protein n=2 Tax=Pseudoxanthomonas winnipegensis TaxID=2480810 RepID=A0A4Q8LU37_9GAMM|nr:porin family protein [Pseudoxanthomonas winnipegensis]TAA35351.1 porin family protein [Pseudoxanthomonas winnipegensis]
MMKTKLLCAVVAACGCGLPATALKAQTSDRDWYAGAKLAYVHNDAFRTDRAGVAGEALVGTTAGAHWNLEASVQLADLDAKDDMAVVAADALYFFDRDAKIAPYVTAGLGYAYEGGLPREASLGGVMMRAGLGLETALGQRFRLRIEARYQRHESSGSRASLTDPMLSVGVVMPFR